MLNTLLRAKYMLSYNNESIFRFGQTALNAAMVGVTQRLMCKAFHTSAAEFRVVQCIIVLKTDI